MKATDNFTFMASNINQLWSSLLIEELIRHDITDFCIAPGSRSTPLTLAVANHPQANAHIHFDERGLGFLALGISQASQKPVVAITTSGTAVANLYPAVIEAKQSGIPLIIISADRPMTLIDCGANQAIEQQQIFAQYPIFFTQFTQPSTEIDANYFLTTIDHGLNKQRNQQGPIHFNLPFAEPLYPTTQQTNYQSYLTSLGNWTANKLPFTRFIKSEWQCLSSSQALNQQKVIAVLGKINNQEQQIAIVDFCKKYHIALLSDIQSSQCAASNTLRYYDLLLNNPHFEELLNEADVIIQFGEQLISKQLATFIDNFDGELQVVHDNHSRIDPNHRVDIRYNCDAIQWIKAHELSVPSEKSAWLCALQKYHNKIDEHIITPFLALQPFSEMAVIERLDKQLEQKLEKNSPLFIGNSMPIRLTDMFMKYNHCQVFSNRGASGIDGLLASAIGVAKYSQKTTTLLIGDTSFLYDLNSLSLIKQLESTFIIIVFNNDGGAIFNHLPVPAEQKEDFYQLPHGLNFKASCEQFCIDYYNPNQLIDFEVSYNLCLKGKHSLIEVTIENQQNVTQLAQLKEQIKYATT